MSNTLIPNIILDGDLGPDPCDFATLALAHILHRQNKIDLKGVVGAFPDFYLVPALDYVRRYYGNSAIPLGVFKPSQEERLNIFRFAATYFLYFDPTLGNQFEHFFGGALGFNTSFFDKTIYPNLVNKKFSEIWPTTKLLSESYRRRYSSEPLSWDNASDGFNIYKDILKNAADNSITLLVVGQLYNLQKLFESSEGVNLVNQKVNKIIMMIGSFEFKAGVKDNYRGLIKNNEEMENLYGKDNAFGTTSMQINNFMKDAGYRYGEYNAYGFQDGLSKNVFSKLSQLDSRIKIYLLGNEEGFKIPAGSAYQALPDSNPVKIAYLNNYKGDAKGVVRTDPAYDELALYYLTYGKGDFFQEYPGDVVFDDMGKSTFTDNQNGRFYRLVVKTSVEDNGRRMINEVRDKLSHGIEETIMSFGDVEMNCLCVSTAESNNRDGGSGTWKIMSVSGSPVGTPLAENSEIHLLNGWGNYVGGFLDTRGYQRDYPRF